MVGKYIRSRPRLRQAFRDVKMYFMRMKYGLKKVDRTFYMGGASLISKDFIAGPYTFMNYGCDICPRVKVGSYVMFAPRVIITGSDHDPDQAGTPMYFTRRPDLPETIIEDDVWLGCRSIIMAGVKIGRGSVIAAGSVVTKDIEPYSIVAGVPSRLIRKRFIREDEISKHEAMLTNKTARIAYSNPINWFAD